jgi:putative ABC transport system permease protein
MIALTTNAGDSRLPIKQIVEGGWQRFVDGEGLMISEPLAYHRQLLPGDLIQLLTATGEQTLPVLGIYYDYSSSVGMLALQRDRYRALWRDDHISSLSIDASPDQDLAQLLARVKSALPSGISAISNGEIRAVAIAVFDRTFEITGILRILAVLVAFVGVLSALMALQLERSREFAIMRATGMTPGQLAAMILAQTGLMGLMAGVFGIPLGLIMAQVLIEVINERSFGWSIVYKLPPGVLLEALSLAVIAALLAAVYPAWRAATVTPALALREE